MTCKIVESAWASIGYFLQYLDPDIGRIARRLERRHLKILKKKQSTVFNQTCLFVLLFNGISTFLGYSIQNPSF